MLQYVVNCPFTFLVTFLHRARAQLVTCTYLHVGRTLFWWKWVVGVGGIDNAVSLQSYCLIELVCAFTWFLCLSICGCCLYSDSVVAKYTENITFLLTYVAGVRELLKQKWMICLIFTKPVAKVLCQSKLLTLSCSPFHPGTLVQKNAVGRYICCHSNATHGHPVCILQGTPPNSRPRQCKGCRLKRIDNQVWKCAIKRTSNETSFRQLSLKMPLSFPIQAPISTRPWHLSALSDICKIPDLYTYLSSFFVFNFCVLKRCSARGPSLVYTRGVGNYQIRLGFSISKNNINK